MCSSDLLARVVLICAMLLAHAGAHSASSIAQMSTTRASLAHSARRRETVRFGETVRFALLINPPSAAKRAAGDRGAVRPLVLAFDKRV